MPSRPCVVLFVALVTLITPSICLADEEWRPLFNGRDLSEWDGDERLWSVRDGVIHGETTPEHVANGNTFLIRRDLVVRDFEFKATFRVGSANNSGIQYRSRHVNDSGVRNRWVVRGYQHEIRNSDDLPNVAGFIYDEGGKRGRICLVGERAEWTDAGKRVTGTVIDAKDFAETFRVDDWNQVRIVASGNRLQHFLNDRPILDFTDDESHAIREGILALQLHAGAPMWVEYRDLAFKPITAP